MYHLEHMSKRIIRIVITEEVYRKYKVFCAIHDISMTQQTEKIVNEFVRKENENIKIVKKDLQDTF